MARAPSSIRHTCTSLQGSGWHVLWGLVSGAIEGCRVRTSPGSLLGTTTESATIS